MTTQNFLTVQENEQYKIQSYSAHQINPFPDHFHSLFCKSNLFSEVEIKSNVELLFWKKNFTAQVQK